MKKANKVEKINKNLGNKPSPNSLETKGINKYILQNGVRAIKIRVLKFINKIITNKSN